jgi:hypothetical protein
MRFTDGQHAANLDRPIAAGECNDPEQFQHDVLNAETIEFIGKPGKTEELRTFLRDNVTPLMQKRAGFINTILLTSQSEPRRLVAITFWRTFEEAENAMWEEIPLLEQILEPLVDSCSRVQSFRVAGSHGPADEQTEVVTLRPV